MFVWEAKLLVERRACEGRLNDLRLRHTELMSERNKQPFGKDKWNHLDGLMTIVQQKILRELQSIKFIRDLAYAGPIVGGDIFLHVPGENGYQGPSILELFDREAERIKDEFVFEHYEGEAVARGIQYAREILTQPYKFLSTEERAGYDMAEKNAATASEMQRARVGGQTAKRGPGRPKGSTNTRTNVTPPPEAKRAKLMRMNPQTGQMEAM